MKRKLTLTIVKLMIGFIAIGVISYWWLSDAWFSESRAVRPDGIELSAMVPINIYITGQNSNPGDPEVLLIDKGAYSLSDMPDFSFSHAYEFEVDEGVALKPSSSSDGKTFWDARKVNPDGESVVDGEQMLFQSAVNGNGNDFPYYIEQELFLTTSTPVHDDVETIKAFISRVEIVGEDISSKELYKAARISIEWTDENETDHIVIYKYAQNENDESGNALPALNASNRVNADPAIKTGDYAQGDPGALEMDLPCVSQNDGVSEFTAVRMMVRLWFEGENVHAQLDNAGSGFGFEIAVSAVDPKGK